MASAASSNLALLIDADNISYKVIAGLLAEIANYGTASVRRIYGDWTSPLMNGWKPCLLNHSIIPIQQFAYRTGKNATDGAMIIGAMDLLYTGRFSGFCLVSNDSDFTRLAARIREQGLTVYGFGRREAHYAFVAACDKFIYFDALNIPVERPEVIQTAPTLPIASIVTGPTPVERPLMALLPSDNPRKRPFDQTALDGLSKAIRSCAGVGDSYANLADVGNYLSKISPDLNARNYGYDRLAEFVEASGLVNMKRQKTENHAAVVYVRLREDLGEDGQILG